MADEELSHDFAQGMNYSLKGSYGHPVERWNAAQSVLEVPLALQKAFALIMNGELDGHMIVEMMEESIRTPILQRLAPFCMVDPFIVPPDWRNRLEELKKLHPCSDEFLFEDIADDAVAFDAATGEFLMKTPDPAS